MLLENILEKPLYCWKIKPVSCKGNQSWITTGRTDAETKAPILWQPDVKNWLIWKDPDGDCSHEIKRCLLLGMKVMTNLDSISKSRDIASKGPSSHGYGFSSSHIWVWELGCEESWEPKNWCFWTAVLEKTLESPLVCKEIQPVHPKRAQSCVFIGRTDPEAETLMPLATWGEELTHWKRPWCWERLKAGGEGDDRGWDG